MAAQNMVTDLIEPALLIDYVRTWDVEVLRPDSQLTLDRFLPDRQIMDLDFRVRKGQLNDVDVAEYRAWDTPAPMTGRPGVKQIRGEIAPVSRQVPLGEEEHLRLRALETGNDDPIIQAIYDDSERMIRSVQARIELARGDLIDDGAVTIAENGLTLEADFGRDSGMSLTAGTLWTNPAATILADLLGYVEDYVEENGVLPGELMMPRQRLGNLALNTEIRQYAAAGGTTPSRLNAESIAAVFAAEGLPPITFYDTQVRINGTRTRVLPVNKVYLMPPPLEPLGATFYGVTAESLVLAQRGLIDREAMPGVVAVVVASDHPVQTFTVGTAVALPVMPNPNLIMDVVVA